jgi:hypothetical protein
MPDAGCRMPKGLTCRQQVEAKISTLACDNEVVRLRRIWDAPAVTLEDERWRCKLVDRWLAQNPAIYGYQEEARSQAPTRLCACPPQTGHISCEHPHGELPRAERELALLRALGAVHRYGQSTRSKVIGGMLMTQFLLSPCNPATTSADTASDFPLNGPLCRAPRAADPVLPTAPPALPAASFRGTSVSCALWTYTVASVECLLRPRRARRSGRTSCGRCGWSAVR